MGRQKNVIEKLDIAYQTRSLPFIQLDEKV